MIIHQSQGSGVIGRFEYNRVVASEGGALELEDPLGHSYRNDSNYRCQVVRVQEYRRVELGNGADVYPPAWNGTTGGILAIDVGDFVIAGGAALRAHGRGFRGLGHGGIYRCAVGYRGEGHEGGYGSVSTDRIGSGGGGGNRGQDRSLWRWWWSCGAGGTGASGNCGDCCSGSPRRGAVNQEAGSPMTV